MDFSVIIDNLAFIKKAYCMTLLLSVMSITFGFVVGVLIGVARVYGPRVPELAFGFFVDTMRAVPVLVVLVWSYLAFPVLVPCPRSFN